MTRPLAIILLAIGLDAVGIGLIFPILPTLLEQVTHSGSIVLIYGALLSVYALMQFVLSPVLGALSDRYGRRRVLLLSLAGAALDYLVLALTDQLWVLFLGRLIAGATAANIAVATAYITDITPEEKRAQRFGYLHAVFGIGFVIGPVLGGVLGEYWIRAPFLAAAVLNGINFLFALFLLPESREPQSERWSWNVLNPLRPLGWAFSLRALWPYLAFFTLLAFIGQVYGSTWVLFTQAKLDWSPFMVGASLSVFGVLHALVQAGLPGLGARYLGEKPTLIAGLLAETAGLVGTSIATQGWMIFAIMPLFSLGGVGMPALQAMTTREVDTHHQGRLQGVLTSLMSLAAVFGPLVFASIFFASAGLWVGFVFFFAALLYGVALPITRHLGRSAKRVGSVAVVQHQA